MVVYPSGNNTYEFNLDNYKEIYSRFKECIDLIEKYSLTIEELAIRDTTFTSHQLALEWIKSLEENDIICPRNIHVGVGKGELARPVIFKILQGLEVRDYYKEKFFMNVDWNYRDNEMFIRIWTDIKK